MEIFAFCFNFAKKFFGLAKIFFSNRKLNPIIIKIIKKLFIIFCSTFWMYFYWIKMPNMTNKKFQPMIEELFIRCRKVNISLKFITQSYFSVLKDFRLNSTYYLIMKISNKKELQNIAINHSADIDYKDFQCMHKKTVFFFDN